MHIQKNKHVNVQNMLNFSWHAQYQIKHILFIYYFFLHGAYSINWSNCHIKEFIIKEVITIFIKTTIISELFAFTDHSQFKEKNIFL